MPENKNLGTSSQPTFFTIIRSARANPFPLLVIIVLPIAYFGGLWVRERQDDRKGVETIATEDYNTRKERLERARVTLITEKEDLMARLRRFEKEKAEREQKRLHEKN